MATSDEQRAWRCFHCGEEFTETAAAQEHLGQSESSDPACQIDVKRFREMEELLARWQAEDTDLHRHIYGLNADHGVALRREEELGYARGLKDGAAEAAQQAPQVRAEVFEPAFRALDRIGDAPDEIWRRREAEVACFYAVQQYRAALAANPQQIASETKVAEVSDEYVPPSEWDDATIAEKLDTAIKAMLEPASKEEMPKYRATIRIMRKAEMRLRALASSPSQAAERIAYEFEGPTGGRLLGYLAPAAVEFGHNIARYRVLRADHWIAAAPALGEVER